MRRSNQVNKRARVELVPARTSIQHISHGQSHGSSRVASHGTSKGQTHAPFRKQFSRSSESSDDSDNGSVASSYSSDSNGVEKDGNPMELRAKIGEQLNSISTRMDRMEDHMLNVPRSAISTSTVSTSSSASTDAMPSRKVTAALLIPLAPKQLRTLTTLTRCLQRKGETQTMERSLFLQWLNDIIDILLAKFTNPNWSSAKKERKQQLKQITMLIVECLTGWGFQDTDHVSAIYDDLSMQVNKLILIKNRTT